MAAQLKQTLHRQVASFVRVETVSADFRVVVLSLGAGASDESPTRSVHPTAGRPPSSSLPPPPPVRCGPQPHWGAAFCVHGSATWGACSAQISVCRPESLFGDGGPRKGSQQSSPPLQPPSVPQQRPSLRRRADPRALPTPDVCVSQGAHRTPCPRRANSRPSPDYRPGRPVKSKGAHAVPLCTTRTMDP